MCGRGSPPRLPYPRRMSDYSGGPAQPQWGQPQSGQPQWGQGGYSQPVSGPAYGQNDLPVYPSQASQVSPYQQPAYPVSGYPGYPQGHPAGFAPQYDAHG